MIDLSTSPPCPLSEASERENQVPLQHIGEGWTAMSTCGMEGFDDKFANRICNNMLRIFIIPFMFLVCIGNISAQSTTITRIATDLQNPRGVAFLPDGRMIITQAGTGLSTGSALDNTGKVSVLDDLNDDGDYEDEGEIIDILHHMPGYNIIYQFNPGRDEVVGMGDVIALDDGRVFFTLDDNFQKLVIVEMSPDLEIVGNLLERPGSMNSIVYDPDSELMFIAESTANTIGVVTMDETYTTLTVFDLLAHQQQAVPSGIAIDPTNGDLLVALFSGQLWVYYGESLSFMPGDAKVVRVDRETGEYTDEITGLTTAVDVAVDDTGNLYVAEMTTQWATPMINDKFDLFDPDSPPDAGGYARFTGRITVYPVDGSDPRIIADGLDQPTNLTYHDGYLYVSVGQGTPDRPIWSPTEGETRIVGEIYRIDVTP